MKAERDELGFDAPAPLGHPVRASLPADAPTGPAVGDKLPDFSLRMLSDVSLISMKIAVAVKPHWFSIAQLFGDPAGRS